MNRFTIVLLTTVVVVLLAVETLTVRRLDRASKVQRRELEQRAALLAIKDRDSTAPGHIAVLGNSLMLDAVKVEDLTARTEPRAVPVPYFVLATEYYDWYFGLKRLFAEGMRPRYILLGLSPNQLVSLHTREEYSAYYLFQGRDLPEVALRTHMDATTTSSFMLGYVSEFYSTRRIVRGYIFSKVLPDVDKLLHQKLGGVRDPDIPEDTLKAEATRRLKAMDDLCGAYGARFILVVPPTYQSGSETIEQIGKDLDIPVLVPVRSGELDGAFFQSDGFHLNEKGAAIFTEKLGANLREKLSANLIQPTQNSSLSARGSR